MLEEDDWVEKRDEELEKTDKPKIARACPVRVTLTKGETYLYCTCGESKFQPFCDGTHKQLGDGYKPLKVVPVKDQKSYMWCACKRNQTPAGPTCDGSHTRIDW